MSNQTAWPWSYLIEMDSPCPVQVTIEPLPTQKTIVHESRDLGPTTIRLGGAPWDLKWDVVDSISSMVPDPVHVEVEIENLGRIPDLVRSDAVFLVSDRFRSAIEEAVTNCEFLPVEAKFVKGKKSIVPDKYWWMNSWHRPDLIDWEKSEVNPMAPIPKTSRYFGAPILTGGWSRLELRPEAQDEMLFGLYGLAGGRKFISPALHASMIDASLDVDFMPVALNSSDLTDNALSYSRYTNLNPETLREGN